MATRKLLSPGTRASNIRIVTGEAVLDGTNPTLVETGLHTIYAVTLALKSPRSVTNTPGVSASESASESTSASPSPSVADVADDTKVLTYTTTNGRINVYAWTTADGADPTLVASSGTELFSYIAAGN